MAGFLLVCLTILKLCMQPPTGTLEYNRVIVNDRNVITFPSQVNCFPNYIVLINVITSRPMFTDYIFFLDKLICCVVL